MAVVLQHDARLLCLVGDHKQLPPTILSPAAAKLGLSKSLFERLLQCGDERALLRIQYRMVSVANPRAHDPTALCMA